MLSFFSKALEQLGIGDIDDDEYFEEEFDDNTFEEDEDAYGEYPHRGNDLHRDKRVSGATLRPLSQEPRDTKNSLSAKSFTPEIPSVRQSPVRPITQPKSPQPKVHIVIPEEFADAKEIGDLLKTNTPVILNLVTTQRDLARRMLDFCSGLTYALSGSMEKVADHVFLITPSNVEVPIEERTWLNEKGLH